MCFLTGGVAIAFDCGVGAACSAPGAVAKILRLAALKGHITNPAAVEDRQRPGERVRIDVTRGAGKVLSRAKPQKSQAALQTLVTEKSQIAGSLRSSMLTTSARARNQQRRRHSSNGLTIIGIIR